VLFSVEVARAPSARGFCAMLQNNEELSWLRQLGNTATAFRGSIFRSSAMQVCFHDSSINNRTLKPWDAPPEPRQWRTFELADAMEQGLARELTTHFSEPARNAEGEHKRLIVSRDQNSREFVLMSEQREPLLLARLVAEDRNSSRGRFDFFVASDGDPPCAIGPAFRMETAANDKNQWVLRSLRCEHCEFKATRTAGERELLTVCAYREQIGPSQAMCMDVSIPKVFEDSRNAVWCSACGGPESSWESMRLISRRPKWHPKHRSLTLDFFGRCHLASTKNIQIKEEYVVCGNDYSKVSLLFGKIEPDAFVLEFKAPLGSVQAFAIALASTQSS